MKVQSNVGNDDYVALDKLKEELYLKLAMTNRKIKLFFFREFPSAIYCNKPVICRLETYIGNKLDWKHFFRLETNKVR